MISMKRKETPMEYTVRMFIVEQKFRNDMIEMCDKITKTMEKISNLQILHDHKIKQLEKKLK